MNHSEAGKGSTQRPTDQQKYRDNYELIFAKKSVNNTTAPTANDTDKKTPKIG